MNVKHISLFVLLAPVCACSDNSPMAPTSRAAVAPAASASLFAIQSTNPIEWSVGRRLTWDDFKGAPDASSSKDAVSAVYVTHTWNCDYYGHFTFTVRAIFDPDTSWVKANAKSDALLRHEQGHFDLAEVYARKLRKALSELKDPCKDTQSTGKMVDKLAADNAGDLDKDQQKYDNQTQDGTDAKSQQKWDDRIKKDLENLKAFAS